MVIVEEYAEKILVKALEEIRKEPEAERVLHIKLASHIGLKEKYKSQKPVFMEALTRNLGNSKTQVFLCEDGDVFVVGTTIPAKEARKAITESAALLGAEANEAFAELYECNQYINKILALVQVKIDNKQEVLAAAKKQVEEQTAAQKREQILFFDKESVSAADIAQKRAGRDGIEVLVIEDDNFTRKLVHNALRKYSVTGLETADVALSTYANNAPDVLFLDINLPDVSGHELLERIISIDPNAYVIMLSGNSDKANIMQAMSSGAKGFVGKPFTREKLHQYVERCPTFNQ